MPDSRDGTPPLGGVTGEPALGPAIDPAAAEGLPAAAGQLAAASAERLEILAGEYLEAILAADARSPKFRQVRAALDRLGDRDFVATAAVSARVLERGLTSVRADLRDGSPLTRHLRDLRKEADRLDPADLPRGHLSGPHGLRDLDGYLAKFARSQPKLESILGELGQARFALERDNAAIGTELDNLDSEIAALRQFAFLAQRLDERLSERIGEIATLDPARAGALREDVLFAIRRRRTEILTQLAIAGQGSAALRIVEASNDAVIAAVAAAVSTTAAALRTAVVVAQAVASQRLALEHLEAARQAASALTESAEALEAGLEDTGGRAEVLRAAWVQVRAALDQVEERKAGVMDAMTAADRKLAGARGTTR